MRYILAALLVAASTTTVVAADCPDGPGTPTCRDLYDYWNEQPQGTGVNSIVEDSYRNQNTVSPPSRWDANR